MSAKELRIQPFFCRLRVLLRKPLSVAHGEVLVGYYQNVGVAAQTQSRAKEIMQEGVNDGRIDWQKSEFLEIDTIEESIRSLYQQGDEGRVWYKSGRALFPNE